NLDTQDFKANIPKGRTCEFTTVLTDDLGSEISLTQDVTFEYAQEEATIQSIRGEGTDIVRYMESALLDGVNPGYNFITFNVENNEREDKELSITTLSAPLGISIDERV